MEEIVIGGYNSFIKFNIEEVYGFPNQTSYLGGYDAKGSVEVKSGDFYAKIEIWLTTKDFAMLYEQLNRCYQDISGEVKFISCECEVEFSLVFDNKGHISIKGMVSERMSENELKFDFGSDQSFMFQCLDQLKRFIKKYDDSTLQGNT
ncbi:WapI family immunity protein [Clostridium tunisiense]|uniref:WapI family immunity protein n=1 Tax=Clostridium tunisiense TaxID=219748 RepID=UPI0002FBAE83|nr:hypothetical protein [Clostridium tunisiense]